MILGEGILIGERIVWSGLASLGLLFMSLALRLREDREFSLLGSALSLLCLVVFPDVWINPFSRAGRALVPDLLAASQDFQQIAACAYVWVSLRFTQSLTGRPRSRALRICAAILAALGIGFYLDALGPAFLFVAPAVQGLAYTWAFDWIYSPILIALFAWNVALTVRGWRAGRGEERRALGALALSYGVLFLGGCLDFAGTWDSLLISLPSATTLAALFMGAVGTYLFTARLIRLYENQRQAMLKLAEIRGDLDMHRPLGELGRSAVHISESIRDFAAELRSDADSLRSHPPTAFRAEVLRIENTRRRLEKFTEAILEFARCTRPGERRLVSPTTLASECLAAFTPEERSRIMMTGGASGRVAGDPALLKRALQELIRNGLQAGAGRIEIRISEGLGRISLVVQDDGPGIPAEHLDRIPVPFFTLRKSEGASGLGASIARGIFRTHGGSLAFYAAPPPARGGLLANAILPESGRAGRGARVGPAWILICDEAERISRFLQVCAHLGIEPAVRGSADLGRGIREAGIALVDAAARSVPGVLPRWKRFRLPGDAMENDPPGDAAWLREETLLALTASAPAEVTEVLR